MKKIILFLFAISLFHHLTISQWVQQTSGITSSLLDIDFINENTGWACGDGGVVVKTTNGGINWLQQTTGVTNRLEGIDAVNENIVWSVGWWNTILKTTDGGSSWQIIRSEPTPVPTFRKVYFLNPGTGWLLKSNYILRTTDGGNTFDSTHTVFTYLWDIFFKNSTTGVLCGDAALTMKSTDGGVMWNQIIPPLHTGAPNLHRISFVGDTGWTVGHGDNSGLGKLVFRTTNFGNTWDTIARIQYPNNEQNYAVCFANLNTGYAGGTSGIIYKTTNSGFNWIRQNTPTIGFRNDFWFFNDSTGWCVGGGGHIYKTSNGGTYVNIEPVSNAIPANFELYQNYPNPFNNQTVFEFVISDYNSYKFEIFDVLGKKVKDLFNENIKPGIYRVTYETTNLTSGVYIYRLSSIKNSQSKKFTLVK